MAHHRAQAVMGFRLHDSHSRLVEIVEISKTSGRHPLPACSLSPKRRVNMLELHLMLDAARPEAGPLPQPHAVLSNVTSRRRIG